MGDGLHVRQCTSAAFGGAGCVLDVVARADVGPLVKGAVVGAGDVGAVEGAGFGGLPLLLHAVARTTNAIGNRERRRIRGD